MSGRYYIGSGSYPWHAPAVFTRGLIRNPQHTLRKTKMSNTDKTLQTSTYFTMIKSVHRHHNGKGARFQNHKITSYKITTNYNLGHTNEAIEWENEVTMLINADCYRENFCGRTTWKFYNERDAYRAWVCLTLKYS